MPPASPPPASPRTSPDGPAAEPSTEGLPRPSRRTALTAAAVLTIAAVALVVGPGDVSTGSPWSTDFGTPQHEDQVEYHYPDRLDFGELEPAPDATEAPDSGLDVVAHWYNDFGLEATAASATDSDGWYGWYDWRWNFEGNTGDGRTSMGYDPARHPIIGNYRGDDPAVLGWITHWLAQAGVDVLSLVDANGFDPENWDDPAAGSHWMQQLFTAVPNSAAFEYMLWLPSRGTPTEIARKERALVEQYRDHPGAYTYEHDGQTLAAVGIWDLEALRGTFDEYQGAAATVDHLGDLADRFRAVGYDGVAIFARNAGLLSTAAEATPLADEGVLVLDSTYEGVYRADGTPSPATYGDYVAAPPFPTAANSVIGVATSLDSAYPHPSGYRLPGTSPELFAQLVEKATTHIDENGLPRVLTVYNVSEWAEGGVGLVPTVAHGFGYLDALRLMPPVRR